MKLEFLAAGSADCPLIRLYDFTPADIVLFQAAVAALAARTAKRIEVERLPFVESVGECRLALVRRERDQAVISRSEPGAFECGFTSGTWDNVAELIEPFAKGTGGFQWLADAPGEVRLLISASGR